MVTILILIEFIHFTFHEFCAANYIADQIIENIDSEVLTFIQNEKYNPRYQIILIFVAGRLYQYWQDTEDEFPLLRFFNSIQRLPRDLIGIKHTALLIQLLEACEANTNLICCVFLLNQEIRPWISLYRDHYQGLLPIESALFASKKVALCTFWNAWVMRALDQFISPEEYQLKHKDFSRAIGKLGLRTQPIVNILLEDLKDKSRDIRAEGKYSSNPVMM